MIGSRLMVMLDIETMACCPRAVVYELGIIQFSFGIVQGNQLHCTNFKEFLFRFNPDDQKDRVIDPDTVFWMHNHPDRMVAMDESRRHPTSEELFSENFYSCFKGDPYVWCKGPHFDITILESLLQDWNMRIPWRYSNIRDTRTVEHVCEIMSIPVLDAKPTHDALDDCKTQLASLECAFQMLHRQRIHDD